MRIAPRVTVLIIVGIVIYVSLSLYHWRQLKKFPDRNKQNAVHSVLARDSHEKNWVQVSTTPGESAAENETIGHEESREEISRKEELTTVSGDPDLQQGPSEDKETAPGPAKKNPQLIPEELTDVREALQKERKENQQQKEKIKELSARIITLQATLEETSAALQEKEQALAKPDTAGPGETVPREKGHSAEKIASLKRSLGSKIDALAKANERIQGLAGRLDQTKRALEDLESSNTHFKAVLAETEAAKIQALQKTENLSGELLQIREDRDTYLAETGRLHAKLQQANTRLTRLENDQNSKQRQVEAMLRYGQQQNELINPFRQEIEILNARVEDRNREIIEAEDQLSTLLGEKESLEQKIVRLQLEIQKNAHLSQELKQTSQDLNMQQKRSADLSGQLKVLADQLQERDGSINSVRTDLADTQDTLREAELEAARLKEENTQQQQDLAQTSQQLSQLQQQLAATEADQLQAAAELERERSAKDALMQEMVELQQNMEKIRAESMQLAAQLEEKNSTLSSANTIPEETTPPSESSGPEDVPAPDQTQAELARAEETIKQLRDSLTAAEARLAETEPAMQQLKQSLEEAERNKTDDTALQNLQQELAQLKSVNKEKVREQKDLAQMIEELQETKIKQQERINELENNLDNYAKLKAELDKKGAALLDRQETISSLKEEGAELLSELDQRETAFFDMQEKYTSLQEKFASVQQERNALFLYTLDSDLDSVSDAVDKCPDTFEGAETGADGCELDSDRDGLVDRLDLCPASSEGVSINTLGCSDGEPIVLTGLYFSGGNAELSPAAQSYLDGVADVLLQNGDVYLEVGGHTDSIGDIDRNKTVSRQRAESVTAYLTEKGVKENRLIPVGYGSEQPIADNETAEGRAANRRVELKIAAPDEVNSTPEQEQTATPAAEEDLPAR